MSPKQFWWKISKLTKNYNTFTEKISEIDHCNFYHWENPTYNPSWRYQHNVNNFQSYLAHVNQKKRLLQKLIFDTVLILTVKSRKRLHRVQNKTQGAEKITKHRQMRTVKSWPHQCISCKQKRSGQERQKLMDPQRKSQKLKRNRKLNQSSLQQTSSPSAQRERWKIREHCITL